MPISNFLFKNITPEQTVIKNVTWLVAGNFCSRLIRAVVVILAARILGVDQYGVFSLALGTASIFMFLSDFGLNSVMVREVAKDEESRTRWISTSFLVKIGLLVISFLAIIFAAPHFTKIPEAKALLPIFAFIMAFEGLRGFGLVIAQALERMEWNALVEVLANITIVALGLTALFIAPSPLNLAIAYLVGGVMGAAIAFWPIRTHLQYFFQNFDRKLLKPILYVGLPIAIGGFFGLILTYTDTIMLGYFKNAETVGLYSAALKPVQLLISLPAFLSASIFPIFARRAKSGDLGSALSKSINAVTLLAIPLVTGGAFLAQPLIETLYGNAYADSANIFRVLTTMLLFSFPAIIASQAIFAHNIQAKMVKFIAIAAVFNFIGNYLLIPQYGAIGAAITTTISQFIATASAFIILKRIQPISVAGPIKRGLAAATAMMIGLIIFAAIEAPFWFLILAGAAFYFLSLSLLKEPLVSEILRIFKKI